MHIYFYLMVTIYIWNAGFDMKLNWPTQYASEPSICVLSSYEYRYLQIDIINSFCYVQWQREWAWHLGFISNLYTWVDFKWIGGQKQFNILPFLEVFPWNTLVYISWALPSQPWILFECNQFHLLPTSCFQVTLLQVLWMQRSDSVILSL